MSRILTPLLALLTMAVSAPAAGEPHDQAIKIVTQIRRADYEGDRAALKRLSGDLAPFEDDKDFGARVRYWRGFALWRRAINAFNETPTPSDIEQDLQDAITEFDKAAARDANFADANIAMASCLGYLVYLHQKDEAQMKAYVARVIPILREVRASAPDNPRLYWVLGPMYWSRPLENGGGEAKAFEAYEKGLEAIRSHRGGATDPLEPSWGEPELLMNLAWSNLNRTTPDLDAAEQYAHSALELVPYWHYVRDILVPQIRTAKKQKELKNLDSEDSRSHFML